jgi:hypothetical protein
VDGEDASRRIAERLKYTAHSTPQAGMFVAGRLLRETGRGHKGVERAVWMGPCLERREEFIAEAKRQFYSALNTYIDQQERNAKD